jgi:endonuclease YncB( thermonuclease family)
MLTKSFALAAVLVLAAALPCAAADLSGKARVVDGDTLEIGGQMVRIEGIDAFETGQTCFDAKGRAWACGSAGRKLLMRLTQGATVTCRGNEMDQYGRLIADCLAGGRNLGATMVESGLAVVFVKFSDTYVSQEKAARAARAGAWAGEFMLPWEYRSMRWTEEAGAAPGACPIKGNISENGRIYHTPYSDSYARTRIDESKGERWFCSEAEALAAGWRAARD